MKTDKIALVGMMASGKTTLGRSLADSLSAPFVDVDRMLEKIAGMPVSGIFKTHGEEEFRSLERLAVRELLNREGTLVMALGGGSFIQPPVREALRNKAVTVYLKVDPAELARRLKATDIASRPMLSGPDWMDRARTLTADRDPVYALADLTFDAGGNDVSVLTENLRSVLARRAGGMREAAKRMMPEAVNA